MDYLKVRELINSTLQDKGIEHEITPYDHETMLVALLDYIHQVSVTGQSILNGYASEETFPATPDNGKLCYIACCKKDTLFKYFDGVNHSPIQINVPTGIAVFVVLLWNGRCFEKQERSSDVEALYGDFNQDFNNDFLNQQKL